MTIKQNETLSYIAKSLQGAKAHGFPMPANLNCTGFSLDDEGNVYISLHNENSSETRYWMPFKVELCGNRKDMEVMNLKGFRTYEDLAAIVSEDVLSPKKPADCAQEAVSIVMNEYRRARNIEPPVHPDVKEQGIKDFDQHDQPESYPQRRMRLINMVEKLTSDAGSLPGANRFMLTRETLNEISEVLRSVDAEIWQGVSEKVDELEKQGVMPAQEAVDLGPIVHGPNAHHDARTTALQTIAEVMQRIEVKLDEDRVEHVCASAPIFTELPDQPTSGPIPEGCSLSYEEMSKELESWMLTATKAQEDRDKLNGTLAAIHDHLALIRNSASSHIETLTNSVKTLDVITGECRELIWPKPSS